MTEILSISFSFLNCVLCHRRRGSDIKGDIKRKLTKISDPSVNSSDPSSTGDCSITAKNLQNGSVKDNIYITNESRLICSRNRLDTKSNSLANESISTSKVNLLPSDSCSVLMKQSADKISTSEQADIYKRLEIVVRRLERLLDTNDLCNFHLLIIQLLSE